MQDLNELLSTAKEKIPSGLVIKIDAIINCQSGLYPDEKKLISSFSLGRKREFTAGRVLAREALVELERKPCSILSDKNGCPIWPDSIVGSISHKGRICTAFLGLKERVTSVGIDLELQEPLQQPMWSSFATDEEVIQANVTNFSDENFANMVFSAKEAFYKCIYPIARETTPKVKEILIEINNLDGLFSLNTSFDGCICEGRMLLRSPYILALVWLCGKNV